jgi:hypothetical protein
MSETADEKVAKELRSSLENLLNDYFGAFSEIASELNKKVSIFQCGTMIEFENGKVFQILFTRQLTNDYINVGMVNDYGVCDREIDYDDAVIINKYVLEMSTKIHEQRVAGYNNLLNGPASIDGIYSLPSASKMPIYKSKDTDYNFVEGPGRVTMKQR